MFGIIFSFVASQILYFALHLESSSFPKPLSARDEIAAFEAMKNGDMAARDKLIRAQSAPRGAHRKKILRFFHRPGGPDQHRNHRPYQGGEQL